MTGVVILISGGDLYESLYEVKQKFEFSLIPGGYGGKKDDKKSAFLLMPGCSTACLREEEISGST